MTTEEDVERLLREHRARLVCELEAVEEELSKRSPLPSRAALVRAREELTTQLRAATR